MFNDPRIVKLHIVNNIYMYIYEYTEHTAAVQKRQNIASVLQNNVQVGDRIVLTRIHIPRIVSYTKGILDKCICTYIDWIVLGGVSWSRLTLIINSKTKTICDTLVQKPREQITTLVYKCECRDIINRQPIQCMDVGC